jgi:hypothetical protein
MIVLASACAKREPPTATASQPVSVGASPRHPESRATPLRSGDARTATSTAPPTPTTTANDLAAAIPARSQAPESPSDGWCGETAIQEALLHLGVFAPQAAINAAGHPAHPDLYSNEIPRTLDALGVKYTSYAPARRGYAPFAAWVSAALDEGDPVLAGVKIFPTQHPEWALDHFVLVVAHGEKGLLVNTTWGDRAWVGDTTTPGLSFKDAVYGLRLRGRALPAGTSIARLSVLEEKDDAVKLHVSCASADGSRAVAIEQRDATKDAALEWTTDAAASADRVVSATRVTSFDCKSR